MPAVNIVADPSLDASKVAAAASCQDWPWIVFARMRAWQASS